MRLFVGDHMMCSEFMWVDRYLYQLLVVCDTIVLVAISPVSYFRCEILVVSYSVFRCHSCQISHLLVVRLSVSVDIGSCWRYQLLLHIKSYWLLVNKRHHNLGTGVIACWCMSCILEGRIMVPSCRFQPWGTKVVLATYAVVSCQGYARITAPH